MNKTLTKLIATFNILIGIWLFFHDEVGKNTNLKHISFIDSPIFWILSIFLGVSLFYSVSKRYVGIQRMLLAVTNIMWTCFTSMLIINQVVYNIPNLDWILLLFYNAVVFIAVTKEVDDYD